jgi:hypothetical protein
MSSAEGNACSSSYTTVHVIMAWCRVNHKDGFAFVLECKVFFAFLHTSLALGSFVADTNTGSLHLMLTQTVMF